MQLYSFNSVVNSALLLIDKGSPGLLQENCQTGMRLCLPLTRRPKMTCVRDNEWWLGKAWAVGILTIWVTCVLLFAASSAHEFWKQRCKLFPFHNICRQKISKKMKDGWTKAMAMELPLGIGIHLFNTPGVQQTLLSEYISCGGFDGMGSYFHPYSYFLLLKSTTW